MKQKMNGYLFGIVGAAAYGLNPFFTLPLVKVGLTTDSILFYRYFFAMLLLALILKIKHVPFALNKKEFFALFIASMLFAISSLTLYESYHYMSASIASTLLFVYPIFAMLIMVLFFHERTHLGAILAVVLMVVGLKCLYKTETGVTLSTIGIFLVMLSALSYAVYMVFIHQSLLSKISVYKLAFYVTFFGWFMYVVRLKGGVELQAIHGISQWFNVVGLALLPSVFSLIALTISINAIGSTSASILGAVEPLTAVGIACVFMGESLTLNMLVGIFFIILAVTLVILDQPLAHYLSLRAHAHKSPIHQKITQHNIVPIHSSYVELFQKDKKVYGDSYIDAFHSKKSSFGKRYVDLFTHHKL